MSPISNLCLGRRVTGDMDVTQIEQNPNSQYAKLIHPDEVPERSAGMGLNNQEASRFDCKQFTCTKLIHFFRSFGPLTDD